MKNILNKTDFLKSVGALTASIVTLQTDLAKLGTGIDTANVEAKSKDLEKLSEEVKEMSGRAKKAEEELSKMSESAAEYEESKARAEQAESQLEDLKKKLAKLKGEEEVDAKGNPFADDDEEDEDAEASALLKTMSRSEVRSLALAAIAATGVTKSAAALEVAVMALGRGEKPVSARDVRKAKVDQMIGDGQLAPHQRGWAMKTSDAVLAEYAVEMRGKKVGPVGEVKQPNEARAREVQQVDAEHEEEPTVDNLTKDELKQIHQAAITREAYVAQKKADLVEARRRAAARA